YFHLVHGLVHCSGGGQTKCLKYLPGSYKIVKDNLFTPPPVFQFIRKASKAAAREMYQVFNMGHRMEIFTDPKGASDVIKLALSYGIDAKIVGQVEKSSKKELKIRLTDSTIHFD